MARLAVSIVVTIACAPLIGQTVHMHGGPTDRPAKELPTPVMIAGVGNSHFAISTSSPQAQKWFDQGLSLLHCFWDFEALRAFREAARLDPECAMCQWGIDRAMEFGGSSAELLNPVVSRMKELAPRVSDHEQRYIRSIVESFGKKGEEGSQAYQREMEAIVYRYPDDLDAKLLLALSLESGFDEKGDPRPGEIHAIGMLRDTLRDHPDNAAANHYWIHAVEQSEHPEWALESAEKLARLAPGSGHMVHMPGHIFYRTGDYERARESFLASMAVDTEYLRAQKLEPPDDRNYAHNLSYLIANSAEEGRAREAFDYAARLEPLAHAATDASHPGSTAFYVVQIGGTRPRLAIRFGRWQEAIDHPVDFGIAEDQLPASAKALRDGMVIYARAMQALEREDAEGGARESDRLDALLWRFTRERDQADRTAQRVGEILGVASRELAGNVASGRGNYGRAKELLQEAVELEKKLGYSEPPLYSRPSWESLGVCGHPGPRLGDGAQRIRASAGVTAEVRFWLLRYCTGLRQTRESERGGQGISGVSGVVAARRRGSGNGSDCPGGYGTTECRVALISIQRSVSGPSWFSRCHKSSRKNVLTE